MQNFLLNFILYLKNVILIIKNDSIEYKLLKEYKNSILDKVDLLINYFEK